MRLPRFLHRFLAWWIGWQFDAAERLISYLAARFPNLYGVLDDEDQESEP